MIDGDIFSTESPKAYAPLGYGTLSEPTVVLPEDFKNDMPLPAYEDRLPLRVPRPLGATFVDTELQRPSETRLSRKPIARQNAVSGPIDKSQKGQDPTAVIVAELASKKQPLMLGKHVLTEESLVTNRGYLDRILKRKGGGENDGSGDEMDVDGERPGSGNEKKKKARIERDDEDEEKYRGEYEKQRNSHKREREFDDENTVRAENVLRMVDSSLVDNLEKDNEVEEDVEVDVDVVSD